jgi:RNA polymerase sigma-70 factor (ECF subfamily)
MIHQDAQENNYSPSEHNRPRSGGSQTPLDEAALVVRVPERDEGAFEELFLQTPLDEAELVVRAQQGDQWAFEELYKKYHYQILLYLTRMVGNDDVGDDLTQDTFLKAWESLLALRKASCFKSWLYRIATNIAFAYQNRVKKAKIILFDDYGEKDTALIINESEDMISETEILRQALTQVNPTYRSCLILSVVEGLSQQEIADILKMKVNNVSKYVSRGKEDLRQVYHRLLNGQNSPKRRQDK